MELDMIKLVDDRLARLFPKPELYDLSPFSIRNLRDCIILSTLKQAYDLTEPKYSLRENRGTDADDLRMRDSRNMAYAQHYRSLQYNELKTSLGIELPKLLPADTQTMSGKLQGHHINRMQYYELNTLATPLLKAIVNKRICDVKKVSNTVFLEYFRDYDELISQLIAKLDGSDEDVIFSTIALFTLEWKYNVELFYSCAVHAEKSGTQEIPIQRLGLLCADLSIPLPSYYIHTESRFVLYRLKLVPSVYSAPEPAWNEIEDKMWQYLVAKYYIETEKIHSKESELCMAEFFAKHTTRAQWAQFFRDHYNLKQMYTPREWTPKRIRYMRKIYNALTKDQPTPF